MGIGGMWAAVGTFRVLSLSLPVPDLEMLSSYQVVKSHLRERETFEQEEEDRGRGGAVEDAWPPA